MGYWSIRWNCGHSTSGPLGKMPDPETKKRLNAGCPYCVGLDDPNLVAVVESWRSAMRDYFPLVAPYEAAKRALEQAQSALLAAQAAYVKEHGITLYETPLEREARESNEWWRSEMREREEQRPAAKRERRRQT